MARESRSQWEFADDGPRLTLADEPDRPSGGGARPPNPVQCQMAATIAAELMGHAPEQTDAQIAARTLGMVRALWSGLAALD